MAISDYITTGLYGQTAGGAGANAGLYRPAPMNPQGGAAQVSGALESMLDPNSSYIQNARRRGVEYAAQRGGINSSIAAGSAERSALEAAAPLAQQAINIDQNREAELAAEWASQNNFNRAMLGRYSQSAFTSSMNMLDTLQQFALNDPELYTPEVTSGYANFFQRNMNDILGRYFANGQ